MFKKVAACSATACLALAGFDATAADTANVNVTLQVNGGCTVYVGTPSSGAGAGTANLDFGSVTLFGDGAEVDPDIIGQTADGDPGDANVIGVSCGGDSVPTLTLTGGDNDQGDFHRMSNGDGDRISYQVFSDQSRDASGLIKSGDPIEPVQVGNSNKYVLYGKIADPSAIAETGHYSDTLRLTLSY